MKQVYPILLTAGLILLGAGESWSQTNILVNKDNVFVGNKTGIQNTSGNLNVFMGPSAGFTNTSGLANVFVGSQAGFSNTTGQGNLFLGQQAGFNNLGGNYNLFMGNSSGSNTTTGAGNTAVGDGSILHNTTGQRNTSIGQYSGLNSQTGSDNVFIGFGAKAGTVNPTNINNAVALGANAIVSQSNSVILGSAGVNVGIGNSAPSARLHITSGVTNQSGVRLENLTSASPANGNASKFLTVDGTGNVILSNYASGAREAAPEALWQRNGQFLQSLKGEAVIIGSNVSRTPAGYRLYVEDGILTEKVKVAIKTTADWSDKVFDATYRLKSLAEVNQFIQANKHLPGVPSAAEVVEKGVDVGKMDAKLLEKIEELTLYSIQLEKDNQQQRAINDKQSKELQAMKQKQAQLEQLLQQVIKNQADRK